MIETIKCIRCGDCCKWNPCLFSQLKYGYAVLLTKRCPELIAHEDGTTSCKLIETEPKIREMLLDGECDKPFPENPLSFEKVLMEAMMQDSLVEQFNRLQGTNLNFIPKQSIGIVRLIDEATGFDDIKKLQSQNKPPELHAFASFVFETIWLPLIMEEIK